jgi:hypothetical protein
MVKKIRMSLRYDNLLEYCDNEKAYGNVLYEATIFGAEESVRHLIDKYHLSPAQRTGKYNFTPFLIAVWNARFNLVKIFIEKMKKTFELDPDNGYRNFSQFINTPLREKNCVYYAVENFQVAKLNYFSEEFNKDLLKEFMELLEYLLENKAKVNLNRISGKKENKNHTTSSHVAAKIGYLPLIQMLVKYGADVNSQDEYGNTPLHYACLYNYKSIIMFLLQCNVSLFLMNKDGKVPYSMLGHNPKILPTKNYLKQLMQERSFKGSYFSEGNFNIHEDEKPSNIRPRFT